MGGRKGAKPQTRIRPLKARVFASMMLLLKWLRLSDFFNHLVEFSLLCFFKTLQCSILCTKSENWVVHLQAKFAWRLRIVRLETVGECEHWIVLVLEQLML